MARNIIAECRALGLPASNTEEEEEEKLFTECEEGPHLDNIYMELEDMKQKIIQLQNALLFEEECPPVPPHCALEIKTGSSENPEIRELQSSNNKIKFQICNMVQAMKIVKNQIEEAVTRTRMAECALREMQNTFESFFAWKPTVEHQFGLCIERFEDLKTTKADFYESAYLVNEKKRKFKVYANKMMLLSIYLEDKDNIERDFAQLRWLCLCAHDKILRRLTRQENLLSKAATYNVGYSQMRGGSSRDLTMQLRKFYFVKNMIKHGVNNKTTAYNLVKN